MVLPGRIELPTSALPRMRSTTELQQRATASPAPLVKTGRGRGALMSAAGALVKRGFWPHGDGRPKPGLSIAPDPATVPPFHPPASPSRPSHDRPCHPHPIPRRAPGRQAAREPAPPQNAGPRAGGRKQPRSSQNPAETLGPGLLGANRNPPLVQPGEHKRVEIE